MEDFLVFINDTTKTHVNHFYRVSNFLIVNQSGLSKKLQLTIETAYLFFLRDVFRTLLHYQYNSIKVQFFRTKGISFSRELDDKIIENIIDDLDIKSTNFSNNDYIFISLDLSTQPILFLELFSSFEIAPGHIKKTEAVKSGFIKIISVTK